MSDDVQKTAGEKGDVVDKRVKPTLIRRRAKKVEPPPAPVLTQEAAESAANISEGEVLSVPSAEVRQEKVPEDQVSAAQAESASQEVQPEARGIEQAQAAPSPAKVAKEKISAAAAKTGPTGKPVGRIDLKTVQEPERKIGVVGHIEEVVPAVKEDWRERFRKGPKRRKSRAELEMEAIQRAGGLKQYADVIVGGPEEEAAAVVKQPVQDRVFRPTPSAKRRKVVRSEFKKTEITEPKAIKKIIRVEDGISIAELSRAMGVKANELVKKLMDLGNLVTMNQQIDVDSATLLASDYGFTIEHTAFKEEEILAEPEAHASAENLELRPPVVTVMGHVDHGKTSILDVIRQTNVVAGEAGGITQHIGAYQVVSPKGTITFIDTPGHAAFTNMRARGAKVTDLVVLVVAAEDGVKPQTIEAIDHAKAAGVPIIVAINKIDKPEAQPERVKQELTEFGLVAEQWGGDTIMVPTSAITRTGIPELLDMILLQSEMLDLKSDPTIRPKGIVIESKLDKGRGPVATVLVQEGTLRKGQYVVCGMYSGRVRAMQNASGEFVEEAKPSMPVEIQGLSGVPAAGDELIGVTDERAARVVTDQRQQRARAEGLKGPAKISLAELSAQTGETKELKLIVKSDVHGTAEAVAEALGKLATEKVKVDVLHKGVGGINETDVLLAAASEAIVLGFNVTADSGAKSVAENKNVEIKTYRIIYEMLDEVRAAMEGMLAPRLEEKVIGHAEVRNTFKISKVGTIAGCYVTDGKIQRNARVRLLRDQAIIFEGKLSSLKRFKDDAREVAENYECGMGIENFNDVKLGDVIEAYIIEEKAATL